MVATQTQPKLMIGLTGGIGCGKTTVANLFAARGASVIDTDLIAHQLSAPGGAAMAAIRAQFGADFVDASGAMDRTKMRSLIFSDAAAKARLEAILHPLISQETGRLIAAASGTYVMVVVPLLIESNNWRQRVARVLVVDCQETQQIERVMARNGLSEAQVRAIMAAQVTRPVRLAVADDIITNNGNIDALKTQIDRLHHLYADLATRYN